MAVYIYKRNLSQNDIDKYSQERRLVPFESMNVLDNNYIHKIQERFCELGFGYMIGNINGCFNSKLYGTIMSFQKQAQSSFRRYIDFTNNKVSTKDIKISFSGKINGEFDEDTSKEMDIWLREGYINSCESPLIQIGKTWARRNIVKAVHNISNELASHKGIFPYTSFACFRHPAGAYGMPGRKNKSLHCTGLAIDLDEWRGAQSEKYDFFYIEKNDDWNWRVFTYSTSPEVPIKNINAWYFNWKSNCFEKKEVSKRLIDITYLFDKYGLKGIKCLKGWESSYYRSEWWHFQKKQTSDWYSEMQKIGFTPEYLDYMGYDKN